MKIYLLWQTDPHYIGGSEILSAYDNHHDAKKERDKKSDEEQDSYTYHVSSTELNCSEDFKGVLKNIYTAADYLGSKADCRSRDLSRDQILRAKDGGLASAYQNIASMIIQPATRSVDYYEVNGIIKDLPEILK